MHLIRYIILNYDKLYRIGTNTTQYPDPAATTDTTQYPDTAVTNTTQYPDPAAPNTTHLGHLGVVFVLEDVTRVAGYVGEGCGDLGVLAGEKRPGVGQGLRVSQELVKGRGLAKS